MLAIEATSTADGNEQHELKSFDAKLSNTTDPEVEKKRLEFFILNIKKFGEQLRSLALYDDKQQQNSHSNSHRNSFFGQGRQGGSNL